MHRSLIRGTQVKCAVVLVLLTGSGILAQQPSSNPFPGATLSLDQLKQQFFRVSVGRRLKPRSWPNGARVAVALTFDVDNATGPLRQGELGPSALSRGEYGAIDGLPRVLRLLDKHNVPATFFVPAVAAALHPQMIPTLLGARRHEIAAHSWIHETLPTINNEAEERRLLQASIDYLTKAIGKRPVGYRAPVAEFSRYTLSLLREAGFMYDSSLMGSDDAYEILMEGQPSGITELPVDFLLSDAPYFGGTANGSLPSLESVQRIFQDEFDVAYEEGGLYVPVFHPHVLGHRARSLILDRLITHMRSKKGVWFATLEQIAAYVRTNSDLSTR